ncbi:MAG TPA: ATP-binding protein [Aestuariivirgaceae bacterium]|jgi:signal transduction histidine kinase
MLAGGGKAAASLSYWGIFAVLVLAMCKPAAAQAIWSVAWPTIPTLDLKLTRDYPALLALLAPVALFLWTLSVIRRHSRDISLARRRIAELEGELNEAEAALSAEPHILIIWRGREREPYRIVGDMRDAARVPVSKAALLDFVSWLEPESASALTAAIGVLQASGTSFNIGIRTGQGELLEADGRAAGHLATLRLRPLSGERRHITELAYDARKLSKQVERLSAILDGAPFPVWLTDQDRRVVWVNRAYLKAVEISDIDQVINRGVELVDVQAIELDKNGTAEPHPVRTHAVIDGAKRALDIHVLLLPEGCAHFAIDATSLEDSEKELKRHIRAHANTLDKIATAIAIFGPDQKLRFFNSAYADLWELDPTWLETNPADGEILDRLRAKRKLPEQANYRDWKARQLNTYTTLETKESWWHLPDGQSLHVICEQHPFGGVTYLYENVTEKIRLESQYNELIGVQRETLDNLHEGVALFGTDGRLRLYNPTFARLWLLEQSFLDEHPHIDSVITKSRPLFDSPMWDELKFAVTSFDTNREAFKERIDRPDGMALQASSVPLPDGNTLLTYMDVTDTTRIENALRERAEALEAADRLKTNFLSNVSYELRTPLTNIIGFAQGLSIGIAGELQVKQHEYLRHIQESSNDLLEIIDAILDLTTIDAGAMELKLRSIEVVSMLELAANSIADAIAKRDLNLRVEIAENALEFIGDEKRVRQVLLNLLSNAIGFSSAGGEILMGARRDADTMMLWVSDNGKGIDPDFQNQAFERFQSRPTASGHRGPGLGLAIVKSFVELHGGEVSLLSKVNKGTTVICRFPIDGPVSGGKPVRRAQAEPTRMRQAS